VSVTSEDWRSVSDRVRQDVQPAARSRTRRRADDVSGYAKRSRKLYKAPGKCTVYCCGGTGVAVPNNNNAVCREDAPPTP